MMNPRDITYPLPKNWIAIRGKYVFLDRNEKSHENEQPLSSSQQFGVVPQSLLEKTIERQVMIATKGFNNFKHVEVGDFVISLRSFEGGIEYSTYNGIISPAYTVLSKRQKIYDGYYKYYLKNIEYIQRMNAVLTGIRDGKTIRYEDFASIDIPFPPYKTQKSIASYLDRETARIDALIAKKERQIELLQEKRRAIITRAVTKGLDPSVKMKESGIEWIGEIPEGWEIRKFSHCILIQEGQVDPELPKYSSSLLIAPNHIESYTGRLLYQETAKEQGAESGKYYCQKGDVIYSKIRPKLAKATIAPCDCLCSADMYPMRSRGNILNEYLLYVMISDSFTNWAILESDRVAMPKLNRDTINNFQLPMPSLKEQNYLVTYIKCVNSSIFALIEKIDHSISLLREYRSALITAAVSGQIDVSKELVP